VLIDAWFALREDSLRTIGEIGQPRLAAAFIHSIDCKINCLKIVRGSFVNIAERLPPTGAKTGML
jgi:hypothetical protein